MVDHWYSMGSESELGVRLRHSLALAKYGAGLSWYQLARL